MAKTKFDFAGWATKNDLLCGDGRTIRKDAFKDCDGKTVPLVWNHQHNEACNVLGHALLENRSDGVYAYCSFNDSEAGKTAKELVKHGDIRSLSIYANKLKQVGRDVLHGTIREVSLVLAGANPGASIDFVMAHGDEEGDGFIANYDEYITLYHSDEEDNKQEETKVANETTQENGKTIKEVFDSMTDEQQECVYAMLGMMANGESGDSNDDEGVEKKNMKHNVFYNDEAEGQGAYLSHADEEAIVSLAKQSGVGSLKAAMEIFADEHSDSLQHGFEDYEQLFPKYELLKKGEPETLERDQTWINSVISKIHKSPISRIRTRQADARIKEIRAKGYQKKGNYKEEMGKIKMIGRTTDPQSVYIKDDMHRDDIIDITDFDVVGYQWNLMRKTLNETLAMAAMVGDGLDDGDPDKIHEDHVRSVWHDDELYTIHADVDIKKAREELQGSNTSANFGENYIYAEAIITAALYAREKYKGSGSLDFYCTPHLLNVMLLARDLNGRRIYDSKSDLAAALNVNEIYTVEQFEGLTRTTADAKTKKLLGLFVNMADYQFGSTKGGEITKFEDFDMDFNRYKYMLETRLSGSLIKLYSAIALEEPVEG